MSADYKGWATVTQVSPLRVFLDGDEAALDITPDRLVSSLAVDDRVWCEVANKRIIVIGKAY